MNYCGFRLVPYLRVCLGFLLEKKKDNLLSLFLAAAGLCPMQSEIFSVMKISASLLAQLFQVKKME